MSDPVRRLAAEIVGLRTRLDGLGAGPQLAFSSIEDGSLEEYDQNGNLVGTVGKQWDGTHGAFSLSGPPPPEPTAPTVTVEATGAATLGWDGVFVNDLRDRDITVTAPMDFSRVEMHISQVRDFVAETADTLVDAIESPRGGTRPVMPAAGIWYAVLVARTLSGKAGPQSLPTQFEVLPQLGEEAIAELRAEYEESADQLQRDLQANTQQQEALQDTLDNLKNVELVALADDLADARTALDNADQLLNVTFPKRLTDVETKATAANTAAGTAASKATAAEAAATKAAADLVTAKARADAAAASAQTAAAEADAAEAASARATGAAGEAEAAADKAAKDAALALTQAQNAGGNVGAAQAAAAAAQTAADTARTQATAAGTSAAAADAKAAQAAADAAKAAADALTAQQKATTAASEATAAKTSASTASTKATAAETAAATAQAKATTAAADAAAAAAKATAAETSATKASGAAGVAETAADQAAKDATAALAQAQGAGSNATAAQAAAAAAQTAANTAKTQATAAGTSAAAADAKAAQAAADAAKAAADLIVARNAAADARGDADTALARADSAVAAAGSAARVLYSTGNPSGTAREGDTWRKTAGDAGNVIAEWRYTKVGTAAASWKTQQVTGDMVSNLDVGRLSVGSAAIISGVAEKMAIATAAIQTANIENLFVTGDSKLQNVVAERIGANVGEYISLKTSQLVADNASFKSGVAERFAAGIGSILKLNASQVYIGEAGNIFPTDLNDDGWQTSANVIQSATGGKNGGASMRIPASTSQQGSYYGLELSKRDRAPRLIPGQTYRATVNVRSDKAIPIGGARVFHRLYSIADPAAAYVWATPSSAQNEKAIAANTWGEVSGTFTVPEDATSTIGVFGVYSQTTALGALTFSELIVQPVITPALIVDGLMNGQRIVGASIETNISTSPNKGIKINDAGLFAYNNSGVETLRMDGINNIFTGATIRTAASGARWQMSANGLEAWNAEGVRYLLGNSSGLEMIGSISSSGLTAGNVQKPINVRLTTVSRDIMGKTKVPNPALIFDDGLGVLGAAPGVYSPDAVALVLQGKNTGITGDGVLSLEQDILRAAAKNIYFGRMGIYPTLGIELLANKMDLGQYPDSYAGLPGTAMTIEGNTLSTNFKSVDFKIDGKKTPLGSTGWLAVSLIGKWVNYGNDFQPLSVRYLNGTLHLMGTIKGGTNGQQVATLPAGYRPSITGLATEVPITILQGTTWYGGSLYVYADGRLYYNGAPGVWSGTDRVIVNAQFAHGIV